MGVVAATDQVNASKDNTTNEQVAWVVQWEHAAEYEVISAKVVAKRAELKEMHKMHVKLWYQWVSWLTVWKEDAKEKVEVAAAAKVGIDMYDELDLRCWGQPPWRGGPVRIRSYLSLHDLYHRYRHLIHTSPILLLSLLQYISAIIPATPVRDMCSSIRTHINSFRICLSLVTVWQVLPIT